jgi:hypothetical protein
MTQGLLGRGVDVDGLMATGNAPTKTIICGPLPIAGGAG